MLMWTALVVAGIGYCVPRHPSAPSSSLLDAVLHVGLFGLATFGVLLLGAGSRSVLLISVTLAVVLEVVQWWLSGHVSIEVGDIGWNLAGVALGVLAALARGPKTAK
jgi:hypothetical protein